MSANPAPNSTAPRDVIMTSLYNADPAFLTRDLADYLALFLVLVLGMFRLDAVIKRLNIGIRMTRDVGCETESLELEDIRDKEGSEIVVTSALDDEVYERQFCDFACNTNHIRLVDRDSNTERIDLPIILTASPMNRYTESGTNTETSVFCSRKTLISECTQTSRTNLISGKVSAKTRSKIPVLLKKTKSNHNQNAEPLISDIDNSITSSPSPLEQFCGSSTSSLYPSSRLSSSPYFDRRTTPSPTRTITPDLQQLSKMSPKPSSMKAETLKKSSTWTDRDRYCDSSIRNDVLLRSPKDKNNGNHDGSARWSVGENNPMGSPRLGKPKCVRKCRSFGGEVTEYTENLSPQNFVLNPRLRYSSNRRLYKVTYVTGS